MKGHFSRLLHQFISIFVLFSLLAGPFTAVYSFSRPLEKSTFIENNDTYPLYRAHVVLSHITDQERLGKLVTHVLQMDDDDAVVILNRDQLADVARLGFRPSQVNSLTMLGFEAEEFFRPQTRDQLLLEPTVDSDNDGLTDDEEEWWCTDPNDTDSDNDNATDGVEALGLQAYVHDPRLTRPSTGKPFSQWPIHHPGCDDSDLDAIPDSAEDWMGLNRNRESTDRDKFDDGQEVFGLTYCPGTGGFCSYGSLPRDGDWGIIFAEMPSWVLPPGNHPLAAAFPVPEASVVPDSWVVERVTVITTEEGQMTQTAHYYETSVTEGTRESIANTVTWNEWEEVSQAVETPLVAQMSSNQDPCTPIGSLKCRVFGVGKITGGHLISDAGGAISGCTIGFILGGGPIGCVIGGAIGYVAGAVVDEWGNQISDEGWSDLTGKDQIQNQMGYGQYPPIYINSSSSSTANASLTLQQNINFDSMANSLDGIQYAINQQGALIARGLQDITYAISRPRYTETHTNGRSWGGAQTITHEVYEEHTITQGEAFTTGQNWSTAWAVDSSHAANLTFTYEVANTGTEYAHEIAGLIFNIYLGDDTNPIISYPAWQQFPNGILENLYPGNSHTFTSNPIPLTLDQMRRLDLGEPITILLEDYSYGIDEAFYADAIGSGVTVFIEDGVADNDELVDTYVLPTWGTESVQNILSRYFPESEDDEGQLNALWTPEFNGTNTPEWNEHFLSEIAWWNIYLTQVDAADIPLDELTAVPGSALLFRFNRDSDRDGYQDRVEWRYDTERDDPADHPQPEITAGYVTTRTGDVATVLLKIANTGTFDAYGIDAVMYAPDDTVTIGNNTVGGNGRVAPGTQVAVGSLILSPNEDDWNNSTTKLYVGGTYDGDTDRVITFTVSTPGVVGSYGAILNWTDGLGGNGSIDLGSSYHAPLPVEITHGVVAGFDTGTVASGDSFSVAALTPRDTFTYTIESEPYTPPVIVVSYSDPQGSHRFITPVELNSLGDDLTAYHEQMIPDVGLSAVTTQSFHPTAANTTHFVINSPHPEPIEGAHLYLNFVSDGDVVAELPYTMTLQTGPTVFPVSWSTAVFSDTYNPDGDNILIAFWTDAQDNIIDSAARPLNTFQEDALADVETTTTTWNFGTATQGTLLHKEMPLANVGFVPLHVLATGSDALNATPGSVGPAQFQKVELALDTALLPTGPYNGIVTVRTSDIHNPTININISGTIAPLTSGALAHGAGNTRPWNQYAYVPGPHYLNDIVTFNHLITDEPTQTHPLYVYSQDETALVGIGEYGPDFTGQTASSSIFGNGSDGNIVIDSPTTFASPTSALASTALAGQNIINFVTDSVFEVGDEILLIQVQGAGAGQYEFAQVASVSSDHVTLIEPLQYTYTQEGNSKAYATRVPHFQNVTITSTGSWTAPAWNGSEGGSIVFRANDTVFIETGGSINANATGYRGGPRTYGAASHGLQGEGLTGTGSPTRFPNNGGGGGGPGTGDGGAGAGGGSHASPGGDASDPFYGDPGLGSQTIFGEPTLQALFTGGAGGAGGTDDSGGGGGFGGKGGNGGGIVYIGANTLAGNGTISSNGQHGEDHDGVPDSEHGGGGGGAGGSIKIIAGIANVDGVSISAIGGAGGKAKDGYGGAGGVGRIRIEYCNSFTGSTNPPASVQQLNCYIIRQLPGNPNTELTLPEVISDTDYVRYMVPYGQRGNFTAAGTYTYTLTLPKRTYTTFTLDALFENLGSSNFNFSVDIGANGSVEWSSSGNGQPVILNSPALAAGLSNYMAGTSQAWGQNVVVPIRVTLNTSGDVFLTNLLAIPGGDSDPRIGANDLTISDLNPHAGQQINLTATIRNPGNYRADNVIVSYFAGNPEEVGVYLGSDYIPSLAVNSTATTSQVWDTTGYAGAIDVYVVIDVAGQLAEISEANNHVYVTVNVIGSSGGSGLTVFLPVIVKQN